MSEWKEYKLGELCDFQAGTAFPSDYQGEISGDYPFIKVSDMNLPGNERIIWYANNWITEKACRKLRAKIHPKDATVFAKIGVALTYNRRRLLKQPTIIDNNMMSAIACNNVIPLFLYYLLCTLDFNDIASGTALPYININDLKKIHVKIPPLPEQRAIASVLSSLDDKIDLLHRENKTLEAMAETLFRQWFIEEADEGWEEVPLSFLGDIVCGKTPPTKRKEYFGGNIPFIKIPDMRGNTFVFQTSDTLTEEGEQSQNNKTLPPKSICVSCIATVGLVSMTAKESQTNQQINSIVPKKDFYRYYLYLFMKNSVDLLIAMASGGTATLNLNTGDFSKIEVTLPNEYELKKFHKTVEPMFDRIYLNQTQIRTLEKLRDTLLPKLMRGEVRIQY